MRVEFLKKLRKRVKIKWHNGDWESLITFRLFFNKHQLTITSKNTKVMLHVSILLSLLYIEYFSIMLKRKNTAK